MKSPIAVKSYLVAGIFAIFFLTIISYGYVLATVGRGLDLTDESFYILFAINNDVVEYKFSFFGDLTKYLFWLFGNDLASVRAASVVILGISLLLVYLSAIHFIGKNYEVQRTEYIAIALVALALALTYYRLRLITPSYNWLAVIGCNVVLLGLILKQTDIRRWVSIVLLAIGLFILFMAKFTSMVMASIVIAALELIYLRARFDYIISILLAMVLIIFYMSFSDQPIFAAGKDFLNGVRFHVGFGANHEAFIFLKNLIGVFIFFLFYAVLNIAISFGLLALLLGAAWLTGRLSLLSDRMGAVVFCFFVICCLEMIIFFDVDNPRLGSFFFSLMVMAIIGFLLRGLGNEKSIRQCIDDLFRNKALVFIMLMLLAMPFVYVFGSNNSYTDKVLDFLGPFLLLSIVFILVTWTADYWRAASIVVVSIHFVLLSGFLVFEGLKRPYRLQEPIIELEAMVDLGRNLGEIAFSESSAAYIETIRSQAAKHGWVPNTPLIDLTGQAPGATLVLAADFLGAPWVVGGYPGSSNALQWMLSSERNSGKLADAWVIESVGSKRALEVQVLRNVGLRFPQDYLQVTEAFFPLSGDQHRLWCPIAAPGCKP